MCLKFNNNIYLTQEEIDNINNNGDYLVIVNNNVLNISSIINIHPGGKEILLKK